MRLLFIIAALALAAAFAAETEEAVQQDAELRGGESMDSTMAVEAIGAKYWRVRSIVGMPAEWAITHLAFYDSTAKGAAPLEIPKKQCTGHEKPKLTSCVINSSTKLIPKKSTAGKSAKNLPPDTPHPCFDAFKKGTGSYWQSNTKFKDEWLGVQFEKPTVVRQITASVLDLAHSPPAWVVEKSADGDNWVRAVEVTICKGWEKKAVTYTWAPLDVLPASVFSIRSQMDPSYCLGTKAIPDPKEPDLIAPKPIDYGTGLEVQRCKDSVVSQFWYINPKDGRLHNAAGDFYTARIGGGIGGTPVLATDGKKAAKAGDTLSVGKCANGCKADVANLFAYSASSAGGFIRLKKDGWRNLVIAAPVDATKKVTTGYVKLGKCGENGKTAANLALCGNLPHAQWELSPMFQIEEKKQAINCSPYSHQNVEPALCTSSKAAQIMCAKDASCVAYNWVDGTADGSLQNKVWLCKVLHDIHLPTQKKPLTGWELGTRSGSAEDPWEARESLGESAEARHARDLPREEM